MPHNLFFRVPEPPDFGVTGIFSRAASYEILESGNANTLNAATEKILVTIAALVQNNQWNKCLKV